MRPGVVALAIVGLVISARSAVAAPPADLSAYCHSIPGQMQLQVRCLYTERAAQERTTRARAAVAPEAWARCEGASPSWTAMEACLAQPGTAGGASAVGGPAATGGDASTAAGGERGDGTSDHAAGTPTTAGAPAPTTAEGTPPGAVGATPSTIILGPRATAPAETQEAPRATRPVTEDEAERHLQGVLERSGASTARCTKKQYGAGWVTVCD